MYNVLKKFSIHLRALVSTCRLGILLDCPYCPQGHVGLLHLVDLCSDGLSFHKLPQSLFGSLHHQFEVVLLVDGECQTWQGDERVAGAALKPRITGKKITVVVLLALVELVSGIHQAMEEVVARSSGFNLLLKQRTQCSRLYLRSGSREHDALSLLDVHLEIARNIEILI